MTTHCTMSEHSYHGATSRSLFFFCFNDNGNLKNRIFHGFGSSGEFTENHLVTFRQMIQEELKGRFFLVQTSRSVVLKKREEE